MVFKVCKKKGCDSTNKSQSDNGKDKKGLTGKYLCVGPGYILKDYIGSGGFGEVYSAENKSDESDKVAVKVAYHDQNRTQLVNELLFYRRAGYNPCIPKYFHYCKHSEYNSLVLESLGPNLQKVFNMNSKEFSTKTIRMIALQGIRAIEFVHSKNFVHRDIKPSNFLIRFNSNGSHSLCLADFGFAKQYFDRRTKKHLPFSKTRIISGTKKFMSINAHKGIQFSRQDDLESFSYLLIYILMGRLPWWPMKKKDKIKWNKQILAIKEKTNFTIYLALYSEVWENFISYSKNLEFGQEPNYDFCYNLFENYYKEFKHCDCDFDLKVSRRKDGEYPLYHFTPRNEKSVSPVKKS